MNLGDKNKSKQNNILDMSKWFYQHAWNLVLEGAISISMPKAIWIRKATYQHDMQCEHFSSGPNEV